MKNVLKIVESILNKKAEQFVTDMKGPQIDDMGFDKWEKIDRSKLNNRDLAFGGARLSVKWSADIEMRSWGIKSVIPVVHNVSGTITAEYMGDDDDIEDDIIFDSDKDGFKIESEVEWSDGTLVPNNVEIDFATKKIIVT